MEELMGTIGYWLGLVAFSMLFLAPVILIAGFFLQVAIATAAVIIAIPYGIFVFLKEIFSPHGP
jgi:hypothetical protein